MNYSRQTAGLGQPIDATITISIEHADRPGFLYLR